MHNSHFEKKNRSPSSGNQRKCIQARTADATGRAAKTRTDKKTQTSSPGITDLRCRKMASISAVFQRAVLFFLPYFYQKYIRQTVALWRSFISVVCFIRVGIRRTFAFCFLGYWVFLWVFFTSVLLDFALGGCPACLASLTYTYSGYLPNLIDSRWNINFVDRIYVLGVHLALQSPIWL